MKSIIIRILKQLINEPRTLALMLLAPLFVMSLIYLLLEDSNYTPKIGVVNISNQLVSNLSDNIDVITLLDNVEVDNLLEDNELDAVLSMNNNTLTLTVLENNSKTTKSILLIKKELERSMSVCFETHYLYGKTDDSYFDSMGYVFLTLLVLMFTFIVSGMSIVREHFSNTLERLLMTPMKRWQIISGYTCGFGVIAVIQSLLLLVLTVFVLKVPIVGSFWLATLILILLALCAVELGTLISIYADSEFQVAQFIPVMIIPQLFFTGIIPLDLIPYNLGKLSYIMPIYYAATPLKGIMVKGDGFIDIFPWLVALIVLITIVFFINSLSLKKYRRL